MKLLSGNSNRPLSEAIAAYLETPLTSADVRRFSDMEVFVEIHENVRGEDVFIIQSTSSPANDNLMELLVCIDALRRASARRITAVLPYFGYARQDRKPGPRTPISAKLVANLITTAGADRVLTLDLHAGQIQGFFDIPVDHLYAAPVLIGYLRERGIENLTVVSPDVGGLKMSDAYAKALDAPLAIVGKRRISATEVEAINVIGEVKGQDVLLVDDMTETAGTLCAAAELLKEHGAGKIYAGVSHGVLGEIGNQRLIDSSIEELITTDSTPMAKGEKVTVVSIAALLGEGIRRIENDESVSSLFDIVNK